MRNKLGLFAMLLLSGLLPACYGPNLTSGRFKCDPANQDKDCPEGFLCQEGACWRPEEWLRQDMTVPPRDGALRDFGGTPGLDLSGSSCKEVHTGVFICKGSFMAGGYAAPCMKAGLRICESKDKELLSQVDDRRCEGGFFAAKIETGRDDIWRTSCPPRMGTRPVLIGCGEEGGVNRIFDGSCAELRSIFVCGTQGSAWSCSKKLEDATHSRDDQGGVLCCK